MEEQLGRLQVRFQSQLSHEESGEVLPGFKKVQGRWQCQRCGNQDRSRLAMGACLRCGGECLYCLDCLPLGKVKQCASLVVCAERSPAFESTSIRVVYKGTLSPEQRTIAETLARLTEDCHEGCEHLVWAVTGAGKTEMVFEAIRRVLESGGRVGIVAPRIDVCQELAPRLEQAFPDVEQIVLHGLAHVPYRRVPLTIATTHQMLRFYQAFDFLIVDEVDAFPYRDSRMLHQAVETAIKKDGIRLYLTATPSDVELRRVETGELSVSLLPARYHRHPLVVPHCRWMGAWRGERQQRLPRVIREWISRHVEAQIPFLCFVASIVQLTKVEEIMRREFREARFASVSSQSMGREEHVRQMRAGELDFLITTTILERGVTFVGIDVMVLSAQETVFTREVLVQIAGRVGRLASAAGGEVIFFHEGMSCAMKAAIREIQQLNEKARQKGLLVE